MNNTRMKNPYRLIPALLLMILLASCGTRKHAASSSATSAVTSEAKQDGAQQADATRQGETCVTARLRLDLSSGGRTTSVGGSLRMKRDDVVQISIVTFGILEVARIEMTPDYFMLIDKMGRQYVKAAYADVPLLRKGNISFQTLQSYFWNEQASSPAAWERTDFVRVGEWSLPTKHLITIPVGSKSVRAGLTLSDLTNGCEWEKRTQIPPRYDEVSVEELISRIMKL